MSVIRFSLILILTSVAVAQDRPEKLPPTPKSEAQQKEFDARKAFADGMVHVKRGLFLDAVKSFETCLKLDPDAVPPRRMLASAYLAAGRADEALAIAKEVTERASDDHDAWQVYATHLHEMRREKDAIAALTRAVETPSLAKYPDQHVLLLNRLSTWVKGDAAALEKVQLKLIDVLKENRERFRNSDFLNDAAFRSETAAAWERVGEARLKLNRTDEAATAFDAARAIYANQTDNLARAWTHRLHWHLARVHYARHDYPAAHDHLREYLKNIKPGNIEPFRLLADLTTRFGGDAPARVAEFADKDKANLPLQLLLAETNDKAGRFDAAETLYLTLAKKHPVPDVYRGLFGLYQRHGRLDKVRDRLDEQNAVMEEETNEEKIKKAREQSWAMTAVLMQDPPLILKLLPLADQERMAQVRRDPPNFKYSTFDRLARLAARTDRLAETEDVLRQALSGGSGRFFRVSTDIPLMDVLLQRRKYAEVAAHCRTRIENRDNHMHVGDNKFVYYRYLQRAHAGLGDFEEALRDNAEAVELARNDELKVSSRVQRAELLSHAGRVPDALAECEALLKEYPQPRHTREVRFKMASILSGAKRHAESEKILRQLLESDANDARVCNFLGYELADQNRHLDEAERLIRRALELDRHARKFGGEDGDEVANDHDTAAYLDSLAWVLFRKGRYAEARQWLERATGQPDGREEPTLWDHLGDIYYRSGDMEKARAAWRKAEQFFRHEPPATKDGRLDEVQRKLKLK